MFFLHQIRYLYLRILWMLISKGKDHPRTGHEGSEGEWRHNCTLSLTSALDGVGGQRHAPAALPRERPGTHCIGGWVGPRACLDGHGKSRPPHRDSIPRPSITWRFAIPTELSRPSFENVIYIYIYIYIYIHTHTYIYNFDVPFSKPPSLRSHKPRSTRICSGRLHSLVYKLWNIWSLDGRKSLRKAYRSIFSRGRTAAFESSCYSLLLQCIYRGFTINVSTVFAW